jgi:hypothetical protein
MSLDKEKDQLTMALVVPWDLFRRRLQAALLVGPAHPCGQAQKFRRPQTVRRGAHLQGAGGTSAL